MRTTKIKTSNGQAKRLSQQMAPTAEPDPTALAAEPESTEQVAPTREQKMSQPVELDPDKVYWADVAGGPGTGKSFLATSLTNQVSSGLLPVRQSSPLSDPLYEQVKSGTTGEGPRRTAPVSLPLDRIELRETLRIVGANKTVDPFDAREVLLQALAGEDIRALIAAGHFRDLHDFARAYAPGKSRVMVLVLNFILADRHRARTYFKSYISELCELYARFPANPEFKTTVGVASILRAAIETAAKLLFGIPNFGTGDNPGLHNLTEVLEGRLLSIPSDTTLTWTRTKSEQRRFAVSSETLGEAGCADILDALDTIADLAVAEYVAEQGIFNSFMFEDDMQLVVVAPRMDIAHTLKIDPRDAIEDSCRGNVTYASVIKLNHVYCKPNPDWQRVLENQKAAYELKMRDDGSMADLITRISTHVKNHTAQSKQSAEKAPATNNTAVVVSGVTQHVGWLLWQFFPFVLLTVTAGWAFVGEGALRWFGGGACLLTAIGAFAVLLRLRAKKWWLRKKDHKTGFKIGVKKMRLNKATVWQSPIARLLDVAYLRTPQDGHLITNAGRFLSLSGLLVNESLSRLVFEGVQVLALAGSALIIISKIML